MWIRYATARTTILPPLWRNFLSELNCEVFSTDPLLTELINESIMDHLIETSFPAKQEARTSCTPPVELNKEEENIIRYACGYVCMHLRRRFLSSKNDKAVDFIECLDKMREQHDDTSSTTSFLEYTQEWTKKVNRGGLFLISDEAYRFFISLELATRTKLPNHLLKSVTCTLSADSTKKEDTTEIVKTICDDEIYCSIGHWQV